jgi:predicted ATP-dependent endonuclease of OLD family
MDMATWRKKMARISINKLGPISNCAMDINHFTVMTGAQASGKSTVAKAVFFCRTVKDDIYDTILKRMLLGTGNTLFNDIIRILRNKFLQLFGTSKAMDSGMSLEYYYSDDVYIRVSLRMQEGYDYLSPNFVWIDFSNDITDFLHEDLDAESIDKDELKKKINTLFHDEYDSIFIPAGRSLISLLTSQLNYLFATMDDEQKRSIDFCTQKYIERILKIRPLFDNGIEGLISQKKNMPGFSLDQKAVDRMLVLTQEVLKGRYVFRDNEERLYIDKEHYVKINYTSSGQQETVWIFNILLHLLVNNTKAFIILEEPEAHLYPQAQKSIVEMLALISNKSCGILLTTHSPYILGALNNLIYAQHLSKNEEIRERVQNEVEERFCIKNQNAYFLENGQINSCMESEEDGGLIINEVIDGASSEINELYDRLFEIGYVGEK